MKSNNPYSQILINNKNGENWRFYTLDNMLFYTINHDDATENKSVKLMDNVKNYDITVDAQDNIHLVYSCYNGEFCYLKYSNNVWSKSTFYKATEKFEIDFINILSNNHSIHIFYMYKNNKCHKYYKIFHIYTLNNQWTYTKVAQVPLSKASTPYFVDYDVNEDILLLFRAKFQNYNKVYFKTFNAENSIWSTSTELKLNKQHTVVKNFLMDSRGNHHFLYHDNTHVCYINHIKHYSPTCDSLSFANLTHFGNKLTMDYQLFESNNKLWIASYNEHTLHYFTSDNWGESWDEKKEYDLINICQTKFINATNNDLKRIKPIITISNSTDEGTHLLSINNFHLQEKVKEMIVNKTDESASAKNENIVADECTSIHNENIVTDECTSINNEKVITNTCDDTLYDFHDEVPINTETNGKESLIKRIKNFFYNV